MGGGLDRRLDRHGASATANERSRRWRRSTGRWNIRRSGQTVSWKGAAPAARRGRRRRSPTASARRTAASIRTRCRSTARSQIGARHRLPQRRRQLDAADLTGRTARLAAAAPPIRRRPVHWHGRPGLLRAPWCFWIVAALLTLGASLAVLLPLARGGQARRVGRDHDLEVYRDQLAELDRDAARGLIGPAEAERSARRDRPPDPAAADAIGRYAIAAAAARALARKRLRAAAVLAVPLVSWGVYAAIGSPDLPGAAACRAAGSKIPPTARSTNWWRAPRRISPPIPTDGRGWDVLAPIYLRIGRFADAVSGLSAMPSGSTARRRERAGRSGRGDRRRGRRPRDGRGAGRLSNARWRSIRPMPQGAVLSGHRAGAGGQATRRRLPGRRCWPTLPADSPWRGAADARRGGAPNRRAPAPKNRTRTDAGPRSMPRPEMSPPTARR